MDSANFILQLQQLSRLAARRSNVAEMEAQLQEHEKAKEEKQSLSKFNEAVIHHINHVIKYIVFYDDAEH